MLKRIKAFLWKWLTFFDWAPMQGCDKRSENDLWWLKCGTHFDNFMGNRELAYKRFDPYRVKILDATGPEVPFALLPKNKEDEDDVPERDPALSVLGLKGAAVTCGTGQWGSPEPIENVVRGVDDIPFWGDPYKALSHGLRQEQYRQYVLDEAKRASRASKHWKTGDPL